MPQKERIEAVIALLHHRRDFMKIKVSDIVFREDLYPRITPDATLIQKYAENIEVLPPIEINQHNILIDGYHRWTAHKKAEVEEVDALIIQTKSEAELFAMAIEKNSKHGQQMNEKDKKKSAIRLYGAGTGIEKDEIAKILSVSKRTISGYLTDIDKQIREERKEKVFDMYMRCYSMEEIAAEMKVTKETISKDVCQISEDVLKTDKVIAEYLDQDFIPPLYNIWNFARCSNNVEHFGQTEVRIVDNLIYLYTNPFDIVLDVFAGGGSTIDICKKRLRRYYVSDRKPIPEREKEIRKLDVCESLPELNKRWSDVTLTYLDPPYWKQAENQYSTDKEDLANMSLDEFTNKICGVVNRIAEKQSKGVIALIIQPTQWKSENKQFTDHVFDIIKGVKNKNLALESRVSCPYSTQQCTPQQVNWAKENKKLLVLSRELIIWRFV
jgi:transcriptional regulator with XRE-family HTH domain